MRFLSLCLLLLLPLPLHAQDAPREDTLDWRGYYPLAVGNAREWNTLVGYQYEHERRDIVGDTLIGGRHYFVQQTLFADVYLQRTSRHLLRYDSLQAGVVFLHPDTQQEHLYSCTLGAAFNTTARCGHMAAHVRGQAFPPFALRHLQLPSASAPIRRDSLPYRALKTFGSLAGGWEYAHGIGPLGFVGDGIGGYAETVFVRLNGRSYGRSLIQTAAEGATGSPAFVGLYPNPASSDLSLHAGSYQSERTVHVYDTLSRTVRSISCPEVRCTWSVAEWPNGLYVAQLQTAGRVQSLPFMVHR